jgi:SAM-dependent methyltransferase
MHAPDPGPFYQTPLGQAAALLMQRQLLRAWDEGAGLDILGLGFADPVTRPFAARAGRLVLASPPVVSGAPLLVELDSLPFPNALFERVVLLHALEECDSPARMLHEVNRVTAPLGRVVMIAAARGRAWAGAESTPFGWGRSFSRRQLESLAREAGFEPSGWSRALYLPPLQGAARWAESFELVGARLAPALAGLVLVEAVKTVQAMRPVGRALAGRAPRFVPAGAPAR